MLPTHILGYNSQNISIQKDHILKINVIAVNQLKQYDTVRGMTKN